MEKLKREGDGKFGSSGIATKEVLIDPRSQKKRKKKEFSVIKKGKRGKGEI